MHGAGFPRRIVGTDTIPRMRFAPEAWPFVAPFPLLALALAATGRHKGAALSLATGGAARVWMAVRTPPNIMLREGPAGLPGDVIATGTPPGVGFARKPPIFLQAGDVVEVEVEGIGVLRNPVVGPDAA